ncbi:MAG: argininosuccinate synthase [Firmicutes bacterium]|nr:argininosuccinate synthase [Bacillota bacterium]
MKPSKVVLAYSGGLDTSCAIPWLRETYGCDVVAMVADVGQGDDLEAVRAKALASGASAVFVEDLRLPFVTDFIFPTLQAGAVYEGKYLLGTSMARPLIARRQVEIAQAVGADAVAHGCTGKGNDQVRFELTYKAFAPDLAVIAPWREWQIRSREDAIAYAQAHGVPVPATRQKPYSRDQNLWHLSHEGGVLEDPWAAPPDDLYLLTQDPAKAPAPRLLTIDFEAGVPVALDGQPTGPVELLEALNKLGGLYGIGRVDLVENRLVGMKSRGVYETPGGTILHVAHQELESLALDRQTFHYKQQVALKFAELVYDGLWYTPLREALSAFVESTQRTVTGSVRLRLSAGQCVAVGRKSPYSLYSEELATFGADEVYDQTDSAGFIALFGLPLAVQAKLREKQALAGSRPQTLKDVAGSAGVAGKQRAANE